MSRLKKLANSNWTITIVSTMLGIIIGLFLTNYFENNALVNDKQDALVQVKKELDDNANLLIVYNDILVGKRHAIGYVLAQMNDDMELIVSRDSIEAFKLNSASIFTISDLESITENEIRIRGDLQFTIESDLMVRELSHIVWDSYKQTEYMSITKFECLTSLEGLYEWQKDANDLNSKWKDSFYSQSFITNENDRTAFLQLWDQLLLKQDFLLKMYTHTSDVFSRCN